MSPYVKDAALQSKTVIVAEMENPDYVRKKLLAKGLLPGEGYGDLKNTQLRFANFPTHSKEQFELLVDTLQAIR